MTSEGLLIAMVLVPVVVLMALKINAVIVFLSLCLGDVLVQFVSPDANQFLTLFSAHVPKGVDTGNDFIKVVLLLLPVVLTAIFMIRTIHGYPKLLLNLLPALGVGLLGSLLVTPLLSLGTSQGITSTSIWTQLIKAQDLIVGGSAVVCLLVLWLQRPKTGSHKEKHSKH
jgi:hypothetical protein